MSEVTYVSFVPRQSSDKLRSTLQSEDTGSLRWREEKTRRGSEFYFTGPSALARQTHEFVTQWVAKENLARRARH